MRLVIRKTRILLAGAALLLTQGCGVSAAACELDYGLPASVTDAPFVVFGEMHGTVETPRLVGEYVCELTERGHGVRLGLEIPEQEAVDRYLSSDGSASAREALFAKPFWARGEDGRSSDAMFRLLERMRELRLAGRDVTVVAFDDRSGFSGTREAGMTERLRAAMQRSPGKRTVALMGNVHAKNGIGNPLDDQFEPMVYRLRDLEPRTLWVDFVEGSAWVCTGACEVWERTAANRLRWPAGVSMGGGPEGFDGMIIFPTMAASPPARTVSR